MLDIKRENELFLKQTGSDIDGCIINSKKHYRYWNMNPKGLVRDDDVLYQLLRYFYKGMSDKDILTTIVSKQTELGEMHNKNTLIFKTLNKFFRLSEIDFPKSSTVSSFFTVLPMMLSSQGITSEFLLVKTMDNYELFNAKEMRFYSCHVINAREKVHGVYSLEKLSRIPKIKEADYSSRAAVTDRKIGIVQLYNQNPRGIMTGDCLLRALSRFFDISWASAALMNHYHYYETGIYLDDSEYETGIMAIARYMYDKGFEDVLDTLPTKENWQTRWITPKALIRLHPELTKKRCLFISKGHVAAMLYGTLYDTWNSACTCFNCCFIAD